MRQVAEIMYIVESQREEFLKGALHPDEEASAVLWLCGVRRQQYYVLNEFIFMTFEYEGDNFKEDMAKMAAYLDSKGNLVQKRRKDVPATELKTTNWWAPVKRLATLLEKEPSSAKKAEESSTDEYLSMLDGGMKDTDSYQDISYDADEWIESVHIW